MPKLDTTPKQLKAYTHHHFNIEWGDGDTQALADCPVCDKPNGFSVNIKTGLYRCWRSGCPINNVNIDDGREGGNPIQFIRTLHAISFDATKTRDYEDLAHQEGYLDHTSPMEWGVCKHLITNEWCIPGYNAKRNIIQLYVERGPTAFPTPFEQPLSGLFGAGVYNPSCDTVYICEGRKDGIALWEMLGKSTYDGDKLIPTANRNSSLLSTSSVLAIPGLGMVGKPLLSWSPLLSDKDVMIMFDSDHPRTNDRGALIPSAGHAATMSALRLLSTVDNPPRSLSYLQWGPDGYDPQLPHGWDVRDALSMVS